MSTHFATSHQDALDCQPFGGHDATRGVVTASLLGALFWFLVIGAFTWISA
jgi:hypothetical protein